MGLWVGALSELMGSMDDGPCAQAGAQTALFMH